MPIDYPKKLLKYSGAVIRFVFIIINNIYCIPTYLLWMFMLWPLKKFNPNLYYRIEGKLFHWLLANVAMWSSIAGYDVVESGDDIKPCLTEKTLVIANHQSTADVPLMMHTFNAKEEVLPNIMWIMDSMFKYTNFGAVSIVHEDYFISSGKSTREETLVLLKEHIKRSYIPRQRNWMMLFPEGGFLHKRKAVSQRFAEKNNLPVLNHVTLPRIGAMKAIMDVLGTFTCPEEDTSNLVNNNSPTKTNGQAIGVESSKEDESETRPTQTPAADLIKNHALKYVLDITVAYPDGKPIGLDDIVTGLRDACQTNFFYKLYHCSQVPTDTESLTKWLYDRFIEKENVLTEFYRTGKFPYTSAQQLPQIVQQDILRYLIIHLFFITSTYIHVQMFYALFNYYNYFILGDEQFV